MLTLRGLQPDTQRVAVPADTLTEVTLKGRSSFLQISNEGANTVRVYWNETGHHASAAKKYIELTTADPYFEGPVGIDAFWLYSTAGADPVVVVSYHE